MIQLLQGRWSMRNKMTNIAVAFVPLGFIGGIAQKSVSIAILSPIFWFVVFLIIRPKN